MGADPIPLLAACARHSAIISGSTILEVLYDTEFKDSDIDVFGTFRTNAARIAAVNDISDMKKTEVLTVLEYFDYPRSVDDVMDGVVYRCGVSAGTFLLYGDSRKNKSKYDNLQIIESNRTSSPSALIGQFDMSVVMNTYIGRELVITYLRDVMNKTSIYFRNHDNSYRTYKYKDRGIEIRTLAPHYTAHKSRMWAVFVDMIRQKNTTHIN
jgi:hypothetical protein